MKLFHYYESSLHALTSRFLLNSIKLSVTYHLVLIKNFLIGRTQHNMKNYIHETPAPSLNPPSKLHYDVVIVGGGMSGLCAAIASARHGAKTAIVQDRSVFGGNASSEVRLHIAGASCHWGKKNAAETGILMELQLDNKRINDSYNFSIWDGVLYSKAMTTENLTCYMGTSMDRIFSDGTKISSIECYQSSTEKRFSFTADIFIDCTGNGSLGYFAGAEYAIGREGKDTFHEKNAPDSADGLTMGNTLYFVAEDVGHPVMFHTPDWAYHFDEDDFTHRYHGDVVVYHNADDVVVLRPDEDYADHTDELVEKYDVKSGYWWIELGGDWNNIIGQYEEIRYELFRTVYGVWDHIKNGGDHGAENYELVWVGSVPGTRESRRLFGDYVLTEDDVLRQPMRDDAVAYGGWPMDEHVAGGFRAKGSIPSFVRSFPGLFSIPYGCYCSRTIENLMMAGRNISASKLAMGATRVMGTCAIGGEAVGTAAAMAVKAGLSPRAFGKAHMKELRQELLKNDCYIIGAINEDTLDLARAAKVSASSERTGYEAVNVINGISRSTETASNLWRSNGFSCDGETLTLKLEKRAMIQEVRLILDPNLSEERAISISKAFMDKEPLGVAEELLKNYELRFYDQGVEKYAMPVENNFQRLNVLHLPQAVPCDTVKLHVSATNGAPDAHVFEIRLYE